MANKTILVITKTPINQEIRNLIYSKFGKDISIDERIDSNMLGGIIIRSSELMFDGSIKTQLEKLKNKLNSLYL